MQVFNAVICRTRRILSVGSFLLITLASAQASSAPMSCLQGTFLQLLDTHTGWSRADWSRLFDDLRQLRLSMLVVQWSVYDQTSFFASVEHGNSPDAPLDTILEIADAAGIDVYVGLVHDPKYWERIRQEPALVEKYLQRQLERSAATAGQLSAVVKRHPSFKGWYISQEIDDLNWQDPILRKALFAYIEQLSGYLRLLTPNARIALSGFANAETTPATVEALWDALLARATAIDVVLFQDGIGVTKLSLNSLPLYLAAVRSAVRHRSRELRTVIEVFRQDHGEPIDDKPFHAVPANPERVRRQLNIAAEYGLGSIAFGIPEYMSPSGSAEAAMLFRDYLSTLVGGQCNR